MAKRKRRKKGKRPKGQSWVETVRFELIGLSLLAVAVVAMARLGLVGETLVLISRFFSANGTCYC